MIKIGDITEGEITGITKYGIFVRLEDNYNGLIHISEISEKFVSDINKLYNIGNIIRVKVLDIDEDKLHVKLSVKRIDCKAKIKSKRILEKGNGFMLLEEKLPVWINSKMEEIKNNL